MDTLNSMLQNFDRKAIFSLSGKNIEYCMSAYLMRKQGIGHTHRHQVAICRQLISQLSNDIPTYRFDEDFNTQLYLYMVKRVNLRPSSAVEYMRTLIAVLGWSGKHGAELSDSYGYIPRVQYQAHTIALTMSEVSHIYHFDVSTLPYRKDKIASLDHVRDTFVMNAIGYGLRYSDLSRLCKADFGNDGSFSIVQKKTGRVVNSDTDLIYYRDIYDALQSKYPNHEIPYQRHIGNYNHHLKDLCKHLHGTFDNTEIIEYRIGDEIVRKEKPRWSMISSHVARRTFVTCNIMAMHHAVVKVQHGVGHAQSSTTDRYIKDNRVI